MTAFQTGGDIYYRTVQTIRPNTELLVWYGDDYAMELGLISVSFSRSLDVIMLCKITHIMLSFLTYVAIISVIHNWLSRPVLKCSSLTVFRSRLKTHLLDLAHNQLCCHCLRSYTGFSQFGSRPGRSTTHALIVIQHKWLTTLDKGGSVRSLFIDFRKAFDLVDHNILITKLKSFSILTCLLQWFGSYLSSRRQRVKVNHHVSSWKSLNGSMPQGSRPGPLSFIVMIDDLRAPCESHKYVDDTTLSELIPSSCFTVICRRFLTQFYPGLLVITCRSTHQKLKK